jgi:NAD(P)-dependent dehydrogenase (short-subunit alcohol dehydrogenase family)
MSIEDSAEPGTHPDADGRVMTRFVLRTREVAPPRHPRQREWHGVAVVVGEDATAAALTRRLTTLGADVRGLPLDGPLDGVLARFDDLQRETPVAHVFLTLAREDAAACLDWSAYRARRHRGVLLPYLLCQRWIQRLSESGRLEHATLAAVTGLGGDFGLSGAASAVEGGAMTGLLKSVRREFPALLVKAIDAPLTDPPESVAAAVCDEIAARTPEVQVGYIHGRRRRLRAIPRAARPREGLDIARGTTWVVTGGARGITSIVARELGKRYGLALHLLGSTPAAVNPALANLAAEDVPQRRLELAQAARHDGRDPAAEWRGFEKSLEVHTFLTELGGLGVRATYHQCDVSDADALRATLDDVRRQDGPIHGIIHGAGVVIAGRYESKQRQNVEATFGSKIDGAASLMALTADDPLEWFLAFGSVMGRFGGIGQTDYGLASDMLSQQVQNFRARRPSCRSVLFAWPAWDEVGMSVRPESRLAIELGGLAFMPPLEGVEHVIAEMRAGAPEGEVIILDRGRELDHDGILPSWPERTAFLEARAKSGSLPLVDDASEVDGDRRIVVEAHLDPAGDVFLRDHQFQGAALLPSVIGMEALAEAARVIEAGTVVGLRAVEILHPLRFAASEAQRIEIEAIRGPEGIATALSGAFRNRQRVLVDPRRVYLRARVDVGQPLAACDAPPLVTAPVDWRTVDYPSPDDARRETLVLHGASFRQLRQIAIDGQHGWARILVPEPGEVGGARAGEWSLPAAVVDACLVACAIHARVRHGIKQLPSSFRHIRLAIPPRAGDTCTAQFVLTDVREEFTSYDVALYDSDGRPFCTIDGHRSAILTARLV